MLKFSLSLYNGTRMWANVQRDAALPNIGGTRCSTPQSLAKTVVTCAIIVCNFAAILAGVAKIIVQLF